MQKTFSQPVNHDRDQARNPKAKTSMTLKLTVQDTSNLCEDDGGNGGETSDEQAA